LGKIDDLPMDTTVLTLEKTAPMETEITVITASDETDPRNATHFPSFIASRAAIKKVLSPISLRKIRENAAKKPLLPKGPLIKTSCTLAKHTCSRSCFH